MVTDTALHSLLPSALGGTNLTGLGPKESGKVRDIYRRDHDLILVTTDRLSAFDRILGLVPYKGQVLNQLAAFWFEQTRDIVSNHLLSVPDPNVTVGKLCRPLPVEVVVRGYISGVTKTALWYQYSQGHRTIYGIDFPHGLQKNDPLPAPIITPTTKGGDTGHDERITSAQVVDMGLMEADLWQQVQQAAIAVFARGQEIARRAGLILVDTKYEFGMDEDGTLVLIDEVHTPDSSRYWRAATVEERLAEGREPENLDKEVVRLVYAERGYRGDGEPPPLDRELAVRAAGVYQETFAALTGGPLVPADYPAGPRVAAAIRAASQ